MQMQSTYWLEKVLKMICLYVSARLCTLQPIVIHAMQLSQFCELTEAGRFFVRHSVYLFNNAVPVLSY
jgi:hypothetical protein